jgi:hypothetical protein
MSVNDGHAPQIGHGKRAERHTQPARIKLRRPANGRFRRQSPNRTASWCRLKTVMPDMTSEQQLKAASMSFAVCQRNWRSTRMPDQEVGAQTKVWASCAAAASGHKRE